MPSQSISRSVRMLLIFETVSTRIRADSRGFCESQDDPGHPAIDDERSDVTYAKDRSRRAARTGRRARRQGAQKEGRMAARVD